MRCPGATILNAIYRSLKAWRRGDELGGRLEAAESVMHVVRTLFTLERRWPPESPTKDDVRLSVSPH